MYFRRNVDEFIMMPEVTCNTAEKVQIIGIFCTKQCV